MTTDPARPSCGCPACINDIPRRAIKATAWTNEQIAVVFLLDQLKTAIANKDGDAMVTVIRTIGWVAGDDAGQRLIQYLLDTALRRLRAEGGRS